MIIMIIMIIMIVHLASNSISSPTRVSSQQIVANHVVSSVAGIVGTANGGCNIEHFVDIKLEFFFIRHRKSTTEGRVRF